MGGGYLEGVSTPQQGPQQIEHPMRTTPKGLRYFCTRSVVGLYLGGFPVTAGRRWSRLLRGAQVGTMPPPCVLGPLRYVSFFSSAFELLMVNEINGRTVLFNPVDVDGLPRYATHWFSEWRPFPINLFAFSPRLGLCSFPAASDGTPAARILVWVQGSCFAFFLSFQKPPRMLVNGSLAVNARLIFPHICDLTAQEGRCIPPPGPQGTGLFLSCFPSRTTP